MGNLIGKCLVKYGSQHLPKTKELHVFDDGTYRYEPNYTNANIDSSFFKIENNMVFYRHRTVEKWESGPPDDEFDRAIKDIMGQYLIEQIILKGEEDVINNRTS